MDGESIKIDYKIVKKILFKNNYVFVFSMLALFFLLISALSGLGIGLGGLGNTHLFQLFFYFSPWLWFFLSLMFVLSATSAYYEKYTVMFLPLVFWLLFTTAYVRTQNVPYLKDITTGDWTLGPDLDPFLFLRNAIEISKGELDPIDHMRYAPLWKSNSYVYSNIMPWSIYFLYKGMNLFSETSITYAAIIAPVIFFVLSTIFFFLFVTVLFSFNFSRIKSMVIGLIASLFYIFSEPMLHRTTAGIPELESLGMVWFWLAFLFFSMAWKQKSNKKVIVYGALSGLFTGAMSWTWGGYRYIYMAIALITFICFLFKIDKEKNLVIFSSWIIPAVFVGFLKTKSLFSMLTSFNDTGLAFGIFFILIMDLIIYSTKIKDLLRLDQINLPKSIKSLSISVLSVVIILLLIKPSFLFGVSSELLERLLYPFGKGRIGLTVAENRAPYFVEVFGSFGYIFWAFFFGAIMMFYETVKHFSLKKKVVFNIFFLIFIVTFIFSRISPSHLFNGDNFISKTLYLGGLILFVIVLVYNYIVAHRNHDIRTLEDFERINVSYILVLALSFLAIISMRGAIRLFFIISPLIIIVAAYFIVRFSERILELKDSVSKLIVGAIFVVLLLLLLGTFSSQAISTSQSARATAPSAYNQQWQYAMEWVRNNTPEGSIFTHWWDYGYWVQSIGERPTVSDGGHYIGFWDHTVGRYLLTTPRPETALSLMKTHKVSYLLIDSTDLGKYSAFSSIGSDSSGNDRFSSIPTMLLDAKQTTETADGVYRVYSGGTFIDEDIEYTVDNVNNFIPGNSGNSFIGGIIWKIHPNNGSVNASFERPEGVYVYNNQQYKIPLRYAYIDGQLLDFGNGLEAVVRVLPVIEANRVEPMGAVIYLSPKVTKTLFAQLYLLDDAFGNYETLELVHSEPDAVVKSLRSQGFETGEYVYYQGFRGPIKIWKVDFPDNIIEREEFLRMGGEFADMDNLQFTK